MAEGIEEKTLGGHFCFRACLREFERVKKSLLMGGEYKKKERGLENRGGANWGEQISAENCTVEAWEGKKGKMFVTAVKGKST